MRIEYKLINGFKQFSDSMDGQRSTVFFSTKFICAVASVQYRTDRASDGGRWTVDGEEKG